MASVSSSPAAATLTPDRSRAKAVWAEARPHLPLLAVAAVVLAFSWPLADLYAVPGLDGAWRVALHVATADGLDFGPDVVFTYGPLGFLQQPVLVDPLTVRIAFAYAIAIHGALVLTLLAMLRPTFGLVGAALAALLLNAVAFQSPTLSLAFLWAVALVLVPLRPVPARALAAGLGILSGIELLAKLSVGLVVVALGVIGVATLPRDRARAGLAFGAALALTALLGWFGTGQPLSAIPSFLEGSLSQISGYSEVMYHEAAGTGWEYWAAGAIAAIGLCVAAGGTWRPNRRARGVILLWAILTFTTFKEGFVRHDPGHAGLFFATVACAIAGFAVIPRARGPALLVGLVAMIALLGSQGVGLGSYVAPGSRISAFVDQVSMLADGSATNEGIEEHRNRFRNAAPLDPDTFAELQGHGVHVDPTLASTAWAYRLEWAPLPGFQSYAAYTEHLDDANAEAVAADDAPDRILRHLEPGIDGRNLAFDQPATLIATLCHYQAARTTEQWQVLARIPNRCGRPELESEAVARWGEDVPVPAAPAGRALYVEVDGVEVRGLEHIRTTAYKAVPRAVVLNGDRSYRLVPGTAANGLLLDVPARVDFPMPFRLDQDAVEIGFTRGSGPQEGGEISLRFLSLPVN